MNEVEMLKDLVKKLRLDAQIPHQQQPEDLGPQELAMQEGMDDPFQPFDPYISLDTILDVQPGNDHSPPISADGAVGGRDQEQVEPECIPPSSLNNVSTVDRPMLIAILLILYTPIHTVSEGI